MRSLLRHHDVRVGEPFDGRPTRADARSRRFRSGGVHDLTEVVCRIAETAEEIAAHFAVRRAIFVEEQGLFDETDRDAHDEAAVLLIAELAETGEIVGAVRCYEDEAGVWYGGRLAVLPEHRRRAGSIGSLLCRLAVDTMAEREVDRFLAYVQEQNVLFFERMHWSRVGDVIEHCGQPHQIMKAPLDESPRYRDRAIARSGPCLTDLVEAFRREPAWRRKGEIEWVREWLQTVPVAAGRQVRVGDDAAAIEDADGYLLLAAEQIYPSLVERDPYLAGRVAVLSNVNDIYAMGGRPLALVDTIVTSGEVHASELLRGLRDGCERYGVAIVGGHITVDPGARSLSASILGRAAALLTSFDARPGDRLLQIVDLEGRFVGPDRFWNCSGHLEDEELRSDLEILPSIAEAGWCRAARDVSMAGLIGSTLMLLELSGVGARIDLAAVARPPSLELGLLDWLMSVPSYGFVLAVKPEHLESVQAAFAHGSLACTAIGEVTRDRRCRLDRGEESATVWDFTRESFTGLAPRGKRKENAA